jgi:hypothetical protein
MNRLLLAAVVLCAVPSCGGDRLYPNSELTLLTGLDAKELCSCVFVVGQTEEYCREYVRLGIPFPGLKQGVPVPIQLLVDHDARRTSARVAGNHASARFVGDRRGCVLE